MEEETKSFEKTMESDSSSHVEPVAFEASPTNAAEESEARPEIRGEESAKLPVADEAKAVMDKYLRLAAEFENYKRRVQREQEEYTKYANERLLRELLPVLDNLQRALHHAQQPGGTNGLVQGMELTCKQYLETLARFGVKPIPSVGLPFDPGVHQAVAMVEAKDGQAPNVIADEYEKGYYFHDRVLRPAMVTVTENQGEASGPPS